MPAMGRANSMNSKLPEPPSGAMPNMRSMKSILAPLLRPVAVELSVLSLQDDVNVRRAQGTMIIHQALVDFRAMLRASQAMRATTCI
jgi:hypothetical protein